VLDPGGRNADHGHHQRDGEVAVVVLHSDRSNQHLSDKFRVLCDHYGIRQSAGRVATCFDNAVAKSFWSSLM
jgi:putative transposase